MDGFVVGINCNTVGTLLRRFMDRVLQQLGVVITPGGNGSESSEICEQAHSRRVGNPH